MDSSKAFSKQWQAQADHPARARQNFAVLIFSSITINLLSLALPMMTLQVYDRILAFGRPGTLWVLAGGAAIAAVLELVLRLSRTYLVTFQGAAYEHATSRTAFERIMQRDAMTVKNQEASHTLQQFGAIDKIRSYYGGQAIITLMDVPFTIMFLALIAYLGQWLMLVSLAVLVVFAYFTWQRGQKLKNQIQLQEENDTGRYQVIVESLNAIHTVKGLGLEPLMQRRFETLQQENDRINFHIAQGNGQSYVHASAFAQAMVVSIVTAGAPLVLMHHLTLGSLIACVFLSGRLIQPVQRVFQLWMHLQETQLAGENLKMLLAIPQAPARLPLDTPRTGEVMCENLQLPFEEKADALAPVNIRLNRADAIAITGHYDKSSTLLLHAIAGLYRPRYGIVQIDGTDPALIEDGERAQRVAYLPPHGIVYRGTILENLTGFDDSLNEQAKEIAALLGIDIAVSRMPLGWQTLLEGGSTEPIAPGLLQRVAIARALVRKPRILLFDQADRSLDIEGYNYVFRLLAQLKNKAALVLVTEDKNLARLADHIIDLPLAQNIRGVA